MDKENQMELIFDEMWKTLRKQIISPIAEFERTILGGEIYSVELIKG